MDLTSKIKEFRSRQRNVLSWLFTSMLPQRVIVACGNRLTLLLIGQVLVRHQLLCAAVTTEAEAEAALTAHQPVLLVIADPLEDGDVVSLCRKARQQQPKVRILLMLSQGFNGSTFREIDALVDAAIDERDLGGEEHPLVKAFMAIVRAGRYRSPSLRQPQHGVTGPPAPEQRSRGPQLTPREQDVLELVGRDLSDRQQPGPQLRNGSQLREGRTAQAGQLQPTGGGGLVMAATSWRDIPPYGGGWGISPMVRPEDAADCSMNGDIAR